MIWTVRAYQPRNEAMGRAPRGRLRFEARWLALSSTMKSLSRELPKPWRLAPLTLEPDDAEAAHIMSEAGLNGTNASSAWNWKPYYPLSEQDREYLQVIRSLEPAEARVDQLAKASYLTRRRESYVRYGLECGGLNGGAIRYCYGEGMRVAVRWVASCCLDPLDELPLLDLCSIPVRA